MLVRRSVDSSLEYGHPHMYAKSPRSGILADVTVASMTGTLAQIGLLSHFASEIFQDLFTVAGETHARVSKVAARTLALAEQLPAVCAKVRLVDGNLGGSSKAYEQADAAVRVAFNASTMPPALKERYDSEFMAANPDFSKLDACLAAANGGEPAAPCLHKYSNPGLFLNQWAAEEMERITVMKKKKAERKAERKERRRVHALELERVNTEGLAVGKTIEVQKVTNWRERFGYEAESIKSSVRESSKQHIKESTLVVDARGERPRSGKEDDFKAASPKPPVNKPPPPSKPKPPPPPPPSLDIEESPAVKPKPPPPIKRNNSAAKKAAEPAAVPARSDVKEETFNKKEETSDEESDIEVKISSTLKENEAYEKYFKMLKMGINKGAVIQKMLADEMDPSVLDDSDDEGESPAASPSRPPPPALPASPKPARPPPPTVPPAVRPVSPPPRPPVNSLLDAIQGGKVLRKAVVAEEREETTKPISALLEAIQNAGKLKKVEPRESEVAPIAANSGGLFGNFGNEVSLLLGRRAMIEAEETDSSEDEDWDA